MLDSLTRFRLTRFTNLFHPFTFYFSTFITNRLALIFSLLYLFFLSLLRWLLPLRMLWLHCPYNYSANFSHSRPLSKPGYGREPLNRGPSNFFRSARCNTFFLPED